MIPVSSNDMKAPFLERESIYFGIPPRLTMTHKPSRKPLRSELHPFLRSPKWVISGLVRAQRPGAQISEGDAMKSVNESDSIALSLPPRGWKRWRPVVRQYRLLALTFNLGLTATALFKTHLPLGVIASCIGIGIIGGITLRGYTMPPMGAVFFVFFLGAVIQPVARLLPGPWAWNALAFSGLFGTASLLTNLVATIAMPIHRRNDT